MSEFEPNRSAEWIGRRDWRIRAAVVQELIAITRPLYAGDSMGQRVARDFAVDAHVIELATVSAQRDLDIAQAGPVRQLREGYARELGSSREMTSRSGCRDRVVRYLRNRCCEAWPMTWVNSSLPSYMIDSIGRRLSPESTKIPGAQVDDSWKP